MILNSPSHLYYTALPFSPSSSWLHKYYTTELLQTFKVVRELPAEWGMCSRTVLLNSCPWTLSYSNNVVAVGSEDRDILILDAITGSHMAVLPGHTDVVRSLTFSSDVVSLVSGSHDKTVKLWDVQTGGVVKTFHGHTDRIRSVSISVDHTTIASGSEDMEIYLWDIQTGECHQMMEQQDIVSCVSFSPKNLHCLMSASGGTIQQWNTNGYRAGPTYSGYQIAFSPDGTDKFISRADKDVMVWSISSGVIVAGFDIANSHFNPCCFSPDGTLVAATAGHNAYVWDITGSSPHLIETFVGHTENITSLTFSSLSTLISASEDKSVKFWQIGALLQDPAVTNPESTPLTLVPPKSIAPGVKNSTIIPSDLPDGVMKAWGILAGPHKGPLQIPAEDSHQSNIQLIESKLIFVWYADQKINIWDAEKGELLQTIKVSRGRVMDLRVSGDGSKVFCLYEGFIEAWDIWTGDAVGEMFFDTRKEIPREILVIDGPEVWIEYKRGIHFGPQVWDIGISNSSPFWLDSNPPDRLHLNDTKVWEINTSQMKDVVTGKVVLQLPERFGGVVHVQLGGQYLVASFRSREVLILDVSHMIL